MPLRGACCGVAMHAALARPVRPRRSKHAGGGNCCARQTRDVIGASVDAGLSGHTGAASGALSLDSRTS